VLHYFKMQRCKVRIIVTLLDIDKQGKTLLALFFQLKLLQSIFLTRML